MTDEPSVHDFDQWYADLDASLHYDEIWQRHLGLPPYLLSSSLLSWDGIAEVTQALRLSSTGVLLDLACGRGGYGMEVAQRTGATLVGVEQSAVAVRLATESSARLGRNDDFRVADLADTGLGDDSVDAVMCIDAIQFANPPEAAYHEMRHVLRPGGRVVLTSWQATDPGDETVPQRLRDVNLHGGLATAGFNDITVLERREWLDQEMAMWAEVANLDPGEDPALQAAHEEAVATLADPDSVQRFIAAATA